MQIYRIELEKQALKFIEKQEKKQRLRLYKAIYQLPLSGDIKKLKGYDNKFRLRVGEYRVIYDKSDVGFLITVINIDSRGQIYNQL